MTHDWESIKFVDRDFHWCISRFKETIQVRRHAKIIDRDRQRSETLALGCIPYGNTTKIEPITERLRQPVTITELEIQSRSLPTA